MSEISKLKTELQAAVNIYNSGIAELGFARYGDKAYQKHQVMQISHAIIRLYLDDKATHDDLHFGHQIGAWKILQEEN